MNGSTGKSIAGLGFLVSATCIFIWYICIGLMNMRGMALGSIMRILNYAQIVGGILTIAGFGILYAALHLLRFS